VRFDPGTWRQLLIWQLNTLRKVLNEIFAKPGLPASFTKMITASRWPASGFPLPVGSAMAVAKGSAQRRSADLTEVIF